MSDTDARKETTFGPTALATPANAVTIARLRGPRLRHHDRGLGRRPGSTSRWASYSRRATGSTGTSPAARARPRSGAFLDPLADKALVLGADGDPGQ